MVRQAAALAVCFSNSILKFTLKTQAMHIDVIQMPKNKLTQGKCLGAVCGVDLPTQSVSPKPTIDTL